MKCTDGCGDGVAPNPYPPRVLGDFNRYTAMTKIRFRWSLWSLLVLVTFFFMLLAYLEMREATVHGSFVEMLQAERDFADRFGWEGLEEVTFEVGVPAMLKPRLNTLSQRVPAELEEYLSTSVPTLDYHSYVWTYLSANNINDAILGFEAIQHGYFVFAVADSNYAAISLDDGRVCSAYSLEGVVEYEADGIKQFIELSTQEFIDHEP